MDDFFQLFVISQSTKILIKSKFCLRIPVSYILEKNTAKNVVYYLQKSNGWKNLCLEFDEPDLSLPRKPKKIFENPSIGETIFTKPSSFISTVSRPRENIKSLSALIEACEPMKASDLSVSKQKQKEISEWFAKNGHKGKPKVLVITGPSGCGKTLSLKVIAKEHDYEILEWTTPIDSVAYESCKNFYFILTIQTKFFFMNYFSLFKSLVRQLETNS